MNGTLPDAPPLRQLARTGVFFVGLFAVGQVGLALQAHMGTHVVPLWLPSGVAVAGLLLLGPRQALTVWAAGLLISVTMRPWWLAAIFGFGDAVTALFAWWMLVRVAGFDRWIRRSRDVGALVAVGAALGTLPGAVMGVGFQALLGLIAWEQAGSIFLTWWLGDAAGVLVATPPILLWRRSWIFELKRDGRALEALVSYGLLVAAACSAWFDSSWPPAVKRLLTASELPLLLWASLRYGTFAAPAAVVIVAAGSVLSLLGQGPAPADGAAALWDLWVQVVVLSAAGLLVTSLEVARREADHALRESEERFRIAAAFGSDVIYEWDLASRRLRLGRADASGGEWGVSGVTIDAWIESIAPDDRSRVAAALQRHVAAGEALTEQYRVVGPDGRMQTWTDRGMPVRDARGRTVKWIGVRTDITRQLELEEQLRQSQKMESVGQLAGGVAHDFNNLLQVIQGYTQLAAGAGADAGDREASLDQVLNAAEKAAGLTRQLLAFGRRQPLAMRDTDLVQVVSRLLEMISRLIGAHIEVTFDAGHGVGHVRCDRGQIEQAIINLCVNARDAMPQGGRLRISVDEVTPGDAVAGPNLPAGRYVRLRVSDTGVGMTPEVRRRIFEPFFTTKPEGRGTGLGLAVAYGVIRQHGGAIDVDSELGSGTTFTIHLPVAARDAAEASGTAGTSPASASGGLILVAEDEAPVRELTRRLLERAGYRVLTAADGEEALERVRVSGNHLCLAVLDAVMPKLGGLAVARRLRAERPDLPILICSGYPGGGPEALEDAPQHDFLAKPYTQSQLVTKVREMLAAPTDG